MKARELMIGDWVKIIDLKDPIKQISCIDEYLGIVDFWDAEKLIVTSINNVLPIPLTGEILEKNGWEKEDVFGSLIRYRFFGPIDIETGGAMFRLSNNYFFCSGIHYVHELQHALRMCDIDKEITI